MARPIWSGTISFALLSVPVKLYSATRSKDISFNQIERATNQRIKQKRVSAVSGEEVPVDQIVKGYDLGGERYVFIEPDELDALVPRDANNERTIAIQEFVDEDEIDPVYYEKPYYIGPDKGGSRAYRLLVKAMADTNKVAIAKVVIRQKEYLTTLRAKGDVLCMETMLFHDEVIDPADLDELRVEGSEIATRELDMAKMLIETSTAPFEPSKYRDDYRERVMDLIEAKAAGTTYEMPTPEEPPKVVDLMAALEASLAAMKKSA
jgi:DNA end-binding protein Ku